MKKNLITLTALAALLLGGVTTAKAQIFLDDEEASQSLRAGSNETGLPNIPQLNLTIDQYAPLGGEVLVLGLLGGAYLLGKKRKDVR